MKIFAGYLGTLILAVFAFAGCHELGHVEGPPVYGGGSADVIGEVQYVDINKREIEVRNDAGRTENVRYDNQTRVVYRQRNYTVSNLEPGDYVAMRTQVDRNGQLYTDTISVRETAQDRGQRGAIASVRGTVLRNVMRYKSMAVDTGRGEYEFYHDDRTRVRYRGEDYPVQSIRPGDDITVRPRPGNARLPTVALIIVTAKAQEKSAYGGRLDVFEGRVEHVDSQRGSFEIRDRNDRLVIVSLPYNPPRPVRDRFRRIREGDVVKVEGRFINRDRFEMENFL